MPALQPKQFKRQRVDRLLDLRLDDPVIHRDAQILDRIAVSYRKNAVNRHHRTRLLTKPTLYCRLRGTGFPLKQQNGKQLPRWRSLSPWMKVQIATLVLAEGGYMQFKIHLHDGLRAELDAKGRDQKDYLRDRIARASRKQFGRARAVFFVMEDMSQDGEEVRPHAHGSIAVRREPLPQHGEKHHLQFKRLADREGVEHAEQIHGLLLTKAVLRAASGNRKGDRPSVVGGLDQSRNVWTTTPRRPYLNDQWVTYAFKNTRAFSATLGDRRLAFASPLRTEAERLWQLIRVGEPAISQWQSTIIG